MNAQKAAAATEVQPPIAMLQLISGFWISRCIYIAVKLGIADFVKDEPKTTEDLATATGSHPPSLFRVMRALASVGVFPRTLRIVSASRLYQKLCAPMCPDRCARLR